MKPNAIMNATTATISAAMNTIPVKSLMITNSAAAITSAMNVALRQSSALVGGVEDRLFMAKVYLTEEV